MARRIPLPRLTQRQRSARWQRERRQQAVIVTVFSAILFFALGLVAWAATSRFYDANLKPAAILDGRSIPLRVWKTEVNYQLVRFYQEFGVPPGFENDRQIAQQKTEYAGFALDTLVERTILEGAAKDEGLSIDQSAIDDRFAEDYGEFHARHILVSPQADARDKDEATANALIKAKALAAQLKAAPNDQALWNKVARENSDDPGSKGSGGDLGFVGKGQFVKEFEDAIKTMQIGEVSDPVKSQFGYHIIQLIERHGPSENVLVKRWLSSGFTVADVKAHTRLDLLKAEFTKRAQDHGTPSPTVQVHLVWIAVAAPRPTGGNFQAFTDQLKKISDIQTELDKGTDFTEVAKKFSEDSSAEKGGDLGWFAKGMLPNTEIEKELFGLDAGQRSAQHNTQQQTTWYKVSEKDAQRALDDEQKQKIKDNAYAYWYDQQKRTHGVQRLVPGHEFDA